MCFVVHILFDWDPFELRASSCSIKNIMGNFWQWQGQRAKAKGQAGWPLVGIDSCSGYFEEKKKKAGGSQSYSYRQIRAAGAARACHMCHQMLSRFVHSLPPTFLSISIYPFHLRITRGPLTRFTRGNKGSCQSLIYIYIHIKKILIPLVMNSL